MQKMLILTGLGANGKSVLMDLIKAVVDDKNTINAMLSDLSKSYVRSTVEGKLLNVSPDLPKKGIVADGEFKALVGGDDVEAAAKYKDSHTIKPYVRLMVATNNMPNCKDTSNGFFRRLMILTFNRKFAENERNPNLLRELIPEIPGIVAWALEGLYELRAQGRFTIPESSELAVRLYQEEISPVQMFADECLVASTDRIGIRSSDLFMAFRGWCRDRGFGPGSIVTLGRDLSALDRFGQRKSSQTWWLVSAKEDAQEYFRPAQIVPGIRPISPNPGLALAA
jgi:putative DNA primase/helicase